MLGDFKKTFGSVGDRNPKQTFGGAKQSLPWFPP